LASAIESEACARSDTGASIKTSAVPVKLHRAIRGKSTILIAIAVAINAPVHNNGADQVL
jgi:hypothetical protein